MAWGLWTCPVDCLPSDKAWTGLPGFYGDISGPGVTAGFYIPAGIVVLAVAVAYLLGSDSHDGIHHARKNLIDDTVLGSTRNIGRLTTTCAERLIPARFSSWLAMILDQHRIRRAFPTYLLAVSDIQIFTGLAILIRGFVQLCPSPTRPNGIPAYHWQILAHLAWFSTITNQGSLILMQQYFREHHWQRKVRLSLMFTQVVLLMIAVVPTASFNWYSKRATAQLTGPSDSRGIVPDDWHVIYPMLAKSAASPISPALCYFDVSKADDLYQSADPCVWGDFTPLRPPQLTVAATSIIRRVIYYENMDRFVNAPDMHRLPSGEAGLDNSSSPSLDFESRRELYCDLNTPMSETDAFQNAGVWMASLGLLLSWNAMRLFGFPPADFRRRIRSAASRYSRRTIENLSRLAMRAFPTTGHKPDLAEGVVTTPLLALHLTGRLMLDMLTSKLAKVLLLIFAFVQGCITLYPAHDPYYHRIYYEGWTVGQILALLSPLSPLALLVLEVFSRAWRASRNQPAHLTRASAVSQTDNPSHYPDMKLHATDDGHLEETIIGLEAKQIRNADEMGEDSVGPDGVTSTLDSLEYRSSKWMSIAVWLLVTTVTLMASSQLVYTYAGYSDVVRLSILLSVVLVALPASSYAWVLTGLHIRSEATHYASGYRHGSRFVKWMTTPNTAQLMMLTAAFTPLGVFMLTLLDVHASQSPLVEGTPGREWPYYLFLGSYRSIGSYFLESIMVNSIMLYFNRATSVGTSGPDVGE